MAFRWIDWRYLWVDWIEVSGFIYHLILSGGQDKDMTLLIFKKRKGRCSPGRKEVEGLWRRKME